MRVRRGRKTATAISVPVGLRAAIAGRGCLMASATDFGVKDLRPRLDVMLRASPELAPGRVVRLDDGEHPGRP